MLCTELACDYLAPITSSRTLNEEKFSSSSVRELVLTPQEGCRPPWRVETSSPHPLHAQQRWETISVSMLQKCQSSVSTYFKMQYYNEAFELALNRQTVPAVRSSNCISTHSFFIIYDIVSSWICYQCRPNPCEGGHLRLIRRVSSKWCTCKPYDEDTGHTFPRPSHWWRLILIIEVYRYTLESHFKYLETYSDSWMNAKITRTVATHSEMKGSQIQSVKHWKRLEVL